ncbi:OmpA family protein [Vibrio diazotrophicus]|uniref:OmpA family protein n=1 Tax=Vibrio diazotrophicus TaxID=685 RepID=UPI00142DC545|nr:OmpA family protein [Vibrio diazotrophicus]
MKGALIILTVTLSAAMFAYAEENVASDEYDYIALPPINQIADLEDDDNDGVINARDLCPDTPALSEIDNDGCGTFVKTSKLQSLHILFANDSSNIPPVFISQIRQMAEFLHTYPSASIEIKGFASKVGNKDYNLNLSKRRSEAVEAQLLRYGVERNRVRIVGFGDTELASKDDTQVGHALNRRVTATVVGYKGAIVKEWSIFTALPK